jgi:hypothetical protein
MFYSLLYKTALNTAYVIERALLFTSQEVIWRLLAAQRQNHFLKPKSACLTLDNFCLIDF